MRNIVFVISSIFEYGGMARVTIQIANELSKIGKYKVEIISLCAENSPPIYKIDNSVKVFSLPIKNFSLRKHCLRAIKELRKHISTEFEGIVVVDDVGYSVPVYVALHHYSKIHLVGWSHMQYFNGRFGGFAWNGKRIAARKFEKHIVLTKEDMEYYKEICDCSNLVQIYNPKNNEIIRRPYPRNSKKIISCGRLVKFKGFDILIHVAQLVFLKHPDWQWDIYGSGDDEIRLNQLICELGIQDNLFLKGYRTNILELYQKYALNVFTSRSEGCPMAMIEAQSSGLPIISFDFKCGPKDLIIDDVNGYIIQSYNIKKMADKICYLIEHPDIREQFSKSSDKNHAELELNYVLGKWQSVLDEFN